MMEKFFRQKDMGFAMDVIFQVDKNSLILILFQVSFFRDQKKDSWRHFLSNALPVPGKIPQTIYSTRNEKNHIPYIYIYQVYIRSYKTFRNSIRKIEYL